MTNLLSYIIKRILAAIPLIFLLIIVTWIFAQLMPGDPSSFLPKTTPPAVIQAFRDKWRLDDPWYTQLWVYIKNLFRGDLGESANVAPGMPVKDLLKVLIPRTIEIAFIPMFLIPIVGIKTGLTTVKHKDQWQDTLVRGLAVLGLALPSFFLGLLLRYFFGYLLPDFTGGVFDLPTSGLKTPGYPDPPALTNFRIIDCIIANNLSLLLDTLVHLILPIACLTFLSFASITRQTRSSMLDVMEQDFIRTARAKGCSENVVYKKHALRNALIPTVTIAISDGFALLAGTTIIEITFNIRALGNNFVRAILSNDYWLIVGIVQVIGIIVILGNLLTDIVYTFIDPRIIYD
ncbi:MAG: hypothetical protein DRO88_01810 [Promethearchaeia archaeon]|nr:MAG: hypothetical protein DRO88_01810 [Candidatus Lokiarchaeia archaeon]